jgi:chemotaxis protein MotB
MGLPPRRARHDNANAWMVTFTDLVALMLTFFVMIFAMSTVKTEAWQNLTQSLREQLSSVISTSPASPALRLDMPMANEAPGADLDYVAELMRGQIASALPDDAAFVRREAGRLFVSLPSDLLFETGDHALTKEAAETVFALGGVLRNLPNRVEVAGHADPRKPRGRYPSNWELSLRRAQSVAVALRKAGYDGGVIARGYGDAQFGALPDEWPLVRRNALARRVDIVIGAAGRDGN